MPTPAQAHATYITKMRNTVTQLMVDIAMLNDLRSQYTFQNLSTVLTSSDFTPEIHSDITLTKFTAVITSIDNLNTFLGQGNGTNFANVRNF